ncbi:hypothetical protein NQ314_017168 [Rhamnusium bicolor]|uniref:DUF4806 domain-containing protein n=1 Tax=Rhamnusium bicolor TaxID=1586634 RepID=A0AAV8WUN8_9CUCU|nr:hypothetical protein NQ314_017168 [Rhamnusium bicolor]
MTFVGVEFTANEGLAIVSVNWLTLRKKEVFWPDSKKQSCYEKLLKNHTIPDEDSWQLYSIQRCFFNTGLVRSPIPEILGSSKARNLILGTPGSSKVRSPIPETSSGSLISGSSFSTPKINRTTLQSNDKLLSSIFYVREQNKLIISLLMQIVNKQSSENAHGILEEIPHLPINTEEDFIILENYLESDDNLKKLVNYLQKLGGKDAISKVNIILKKILTNELASRYNFFGKRPGKKPFSTLRLNDAITRAVLKESASTEKNVADVIIKM